MKTPEHFAAATVLTLLVVASIAAQAAEMKVLSAIGMRTVMEDLGPKFERATGHKLVITFATLGAAVKRVGGGETFDVVVIPRAGIDGFLKDGKASAGTVSELARSTVGLAIRSGAPKPDISSTEGTQALLRGHVEVINTGPGNMVEFLKAGNLREPVTRASAGNNT